MEIPFEEIGIKQVVLDMDRNMSPDGFKIGFFFIVLEVIKELEEFFTISIKVLLKNH